MLALMRALAVLPSPRRPHARYALVFEVYRWRRDLYARLLYADAPVEIPGVAYAATLDGLHLICLARPNPAAALIANGVGDAHQAACGTHVVLENGSAAPCAFEAPRVDPSDPLVAGRLAGHLRLTEAFRETCAARAAIQPVFWLQYDDLRCREAATTRALLAFLGLPPATLHAEKMLKLTTNRSEPPASGVVADLARRRHPLGALLLGAIDQAETCAPDCAGGPGFCAVAQRRAPSSAAARRAPLGPVALACLAWVLR